MDCVKCGGETCVTDSRPRGGGKNGIRRRRRCRDCGERFTTSEYHEDDLPALARAVDMEDALTRLAAMSKSQAFILKTLKDAIGK